MNSPKEKAIELFNKYYCLENNSKKRIKVIEFDTAKQCALIAVDLIIYHTEEDSSNIPLYEYYQEVKKEIEKL
jgi:hypothetical protein